MVMAARHARQDHADECLKNIQPAVQRTSTIASVYSLVNTSACTRRSCTLHGRLLIKPLVDGRWDDPFEKDAYAKLPASKGLYPRHSTCESKASLSRSIQKKKLDHLLPSDETFVDDLRQLRMLHVLV